MDDQFDALRAMGVTIEELGDPGRLPARIVGPLRDHDAALPGDVSSQFITGLLLAGGADHARVALTTEPISRPYIAMTTAVMKAFGADVDHDNGRVWAVGGGYRGIEYQVEPDASAASYFLAAAAITGGRVRVLGLGRARSKAMSPSLRYLRMGCEVVLRRFRRGPRRPLRDRR